MFKKKRKLKMSNDELLRFVCAVGRYEIDVQPHIYSKALRVTLIELGYDPYWVEDVVREVFYRFYEDIFRDFNVKHFPILKEDPDEE